MASSFFDDQDEGLDEEERVEVPQLPKPLRIIGKIIKYSFWALILAINVLIFWRLFSTGIPRRMKELYADPGLRSAYSAWLADTSEDKEPFAVYQKSCLNNCMTTDDPDEETGFPGNYGYFGFVDQVIFPTEGKVQLIFRYNKSTLSHVAEDYDRPSIPNTTDEYFDVWLRVESFRDSEKRDASDVEVEYIQCEVVDSGTQNVYCYRQLAASGLPDYDNISAIYAQVFFKEDPDYEAVSYNAPWPYGSVCIYSTENATLEYKLDRNDKAALKGED